MKITSFVASISQQARSFRGLSKLSLAILLVSGGLSSASAQTANTWTGATTGDWNSSTWSTGAAPVSGQTLVFTGATSETLTNSLSIVNQNRGYDITGGNSGGKFAFGG